MKSGDFPTQLRSWRLPVLAAMILTLTFVHQAGVVEAQRFHQILNIVPYLPIILGALWFGLLGGIICALLTSVCYVTHLVIHEGGRLFDENLDRTLNILMFNVVGVVTGYLAQRQFEAIARHRKLARELEKSYAELRKKTEELFRSEEHLERASRLSALGELKAGLAHEIGNPLGGIKGAAEILADGLDPGDQKHRFARLLLQEVARLDSVVSRFLDWVRPSEASERCSDLRQVLDAVISLCQQALKSSRLELRLELEDSLPAVTGDPKELQQVFLNLLLNAIHATPPGGWISIRARRTDDGVECQVADSGCGIPPEHVPRLFDPFFTTRPGGTGLGLAITQRILQSCRGRIDVASQPGEGAMFTVTLPIGEQTGVLEESSPRR